MKEPTRRHRSTATPPRPSRVIRPYEIDERYLAVLLQLDPYRAFKYATIPWLHCLCRPDVEYSVFRKYLGYLRQAPNRYIRCPEQQNASPNVPYKTLVYELAERGISLLRDRGLMPEPTSIAHGADKKSKRASSFALHRAHSYYHEVIVDLGYYAPLHYLIRHNSALRLVDFSQLLAHSNVPSATRLSRDPLLVSLKRRQTRFDGTPHLIIRAKPNAQRLTIGVPGIQVDRGTETFERVEAHVLNAIEYIEDRHHERQWGFDNCMIPFLFTSEARKARAIAFLERQRNGFPFVIFKTIPDLGLLHHFPKPRHYDPAYRYADGEPKPPDSIHVFTTPWKRAGFPDFNFNTFEECKP